MIDKHKITKILLLLSLTISTFMFNYKDVYGEGVSSSGNVSGGDGNEFNNSGTPSYGSSCDVVICNYSYSWQKSIDVEVEMKDMYGNVMQGSVFDSTISNKFLAGTYVMLKVYQKQSFYSEASYYVAAKRQKWICRYKKVTCSKPNGATCYDESEPNCRCNEQSQTLRDRICSCPGLGGGWDLTSTSFQGWFDVTAEYADSCSGGAIPQNFELEPMYVAEYRDSNDIDNNNITQVTGHECSEPVKGKIEETTDRDGGQSGGNTLSGECSVSYDRSNTICINVKTSDVRYLDENSDGECNADEYKIIPDEDGYWKYFIPLNANSADDFSFELKSSGGKEIPEICQAFKDKYPRYWENIIKMNPDGTCTFEIEVTIPIEQKFYNEINEGQNFKGFNFYYKPIDINNPFPNGLTESSLWYDWYNDSTQNPDISESYDEITYIAQYINGDALRNYNKYDDASYRNLYRTWYSDWQENMSVDGTSKFIDDEGYVTRYVDRNSYYPLGCGPANTNVDNIFAQVECDTE